MVTDKYIEILLSGLVTKVALAFPVAYIRSISLFSNNNKIADCTWEDERTGNFRSYVPVLLSSGNEHIIVEAIDADGNPLSINTPVSAI